MGEPRWSRERRTEPGWYVWAPDGGVTRHLARLVATAEGDLLWLGADIRDGWALYGPLALPPVPQEGSAK